MSTEFDTLTEDYNYERSGNEQPLTQAKGGLDWMQYQRIIEEIRYQPHWRQEADKHADYYDGNQLDPETLADLEEKGMAPLITNLIKPTIDMVLGMEAKTRSDWRVIADNDEFQDVAEALSQKLYEVERETRADRACSDAYACQIKSGLGWVEVSREADPFRYPYRASPVHRREMFWDWVAKEHDLSDARYVVRKRWFDMDLVALHFPKSKDVLSAALGRWGGNWITAATENATLANAFDQERGLTVSDFEWVNPRRQRICLFEIWYRTFVKGKILRLPDRVVEFDPKNPMHKFAVENGMVVPESAIYARMNLSIWAGPHRLYDGKTDKKRMPYIPFWGYKEDLTNTPYGLIRGMVSPQDEVNARRRKLMNLLSSKRIIADSDSLDTRINSFSDVIQEIARPDSVVALNPMRKNANGFKVETELNLGQQQFQIMEESKKALQESAGVYQAMLGKDTNATSGFAINSLVEQGTTTLAEINDNYRYSRRLVGEMLVDMIRDDMVGKPVQVVAGEGSRKRVIYLNQPVQNPQTGQIELINDVSRSTVKVALEDTPSTPAYRAQQLQMLGQVIQSMPPEAQAMMAPSFVEMTELEDRHQLADQMRKMLGVPDDNQQEQDPEKVQLQQQVQQAAQAIEQLKQQPAMIAAQAKQAQVELDAQKAQVDMAKAQQDAELNKEMALAEIDKIKVETKKLELESELEMM
jgi:hypothetical protein